MKENLFDSYITKKFSGGSFNDKELRAIRSGDISDLCDAFIKIDDKRYHSFIKSILQSVKRYFKDSVILSDIIQSYNAPLELVACQTMEGDESMWLGIGGEDKALLGLASLFAGEELTEFDELAYDSLCELINCLNGAYATWLSHELDVEASLYPPVFFENRKIVAENVFYIMTLNVRGKNVHLIMSIDNNLVIE